MHLSVATRIDGRRFTEFDGRRKGEFDRPRVERGPASRDGLEGEIVVAQGRSVRERAPISPEREGEAESAVDDFGGVLGDGIAVGTRASGFVTEQVRMLSDEGHSRNVDGVFEHVEHGELGSVQEIHERESRGAAATPVDARRPGHRFLLTARLAVDAGTWNTSKYNFSSSWGRFRSAAATSNSSAMFIMTR